MNIQVSFSEAPWMTQLKTFLYSYITGTSNKGKLLLIGRDEIGRSSFGRIFRNNPVTEDPLVDEVVIEGKHFDLHHLECLKDVPVWEHSDVNGIIYLLTSSDISSLGPVAEDLDELKKLLSKSPHVPILVLDLIQEKNSFLSKEVLTQELRIGEAVQSEITSLVNLTEIAIGLFQVNLADIKGIENARKWLGSKIC
ncbi:unnamed protein product [Auanema sp. JU1783]|nr:unnamed protein product [Auanema sp. JU1783]